MRIVCPSCEAEYDVPDAMLSGGTKKVRCARCAREWAPFAPPPPPPAPEPVTVPIPSFAERAPEPAAPPDSLAAKLAQENAKPRPMAARRVMSVPGGPPGLGLVIAWLLTAAVFAAAIGFAWLKRPEIVAAWPPALRLYRLFGLD
jgi:predicted Zn finger-like uncharacterized protein